jgi:hypothetical protein
VRRPEPVDDLGGDAVAADGNDPVEHGEVPGGEVVVGVVGTFRNCSRAISVYKDEGES